MYGGVRAGENIIADVDDDGLADISGVAEIGTEIERGLEIDIGVGLKKRAIAYHRRGITINDQFQVVAELGEMRCDFQTSQPDARQARKSPAIEFSERVWDEEKNAHLGEALPEWLMDGVDRIPPPLQQRRVPEEVEIASGIGL